MPAERIPASEVARITGEVAVEFERRKARPVVLVVETDVARRARAIAAVRDRVPDVDIVAAGCEREALEGVGRAPALVWLADDDCIDAAVIVGAVRRCCVGSSIWLRHSARRHAPERAINLGLSSSHDGEALLDFFP